jgi:hypothetical protein
MLQFDSIGRVSGRFGTRNCQSSEVTTERRHGAVVQGLGSRKYELLELIGTTRGMSL